MKKKTDRMILWASVLCFLVMSLSLLLIPVETVGYFPAMLFWGGMLGGVVLQILLGMRRKAAVTRRERKGKRIGLLVVGSSREAWFVDGVFLGSILFTVLAFVLTRGMGYICYCAIALTLFSFCMHCILNGRNYSRLYDSNKARRKPDDQKVSNQERK